jgi:hypothetical protein
MYNIVERINYHSEKFKELIEAQAEVSELHTDDYGWENYRYESPIFRLAHVERYFVGALAVCHITCFPHKNSKAPVFGFDVVGGIKNGKISGAFIDCSPIISDSKWHNTEWNKDRKLPYWATVFSEQFIAVRPDEDEYEKLFETGWDVFQTYIDRLNSGVDLTDDPTELDTIIKNQNAYCVHQADNPRTFGALKTKIGEEKARYFMEKVLFPQIKNEEN